MDEFCPDYDDFPVLPGWMSLMALKNSSLLLPFMADMATINDLSGVNMQFLPGTYNPDTLVLTWKKLLDKKRIISIVGFDPKIDKDTLLNHNELDYWINNNMQGIFLEKDKLVNETANLFTSNYIREIANFSGLIVTEFPENNIKQYFRDFSPDLFMVKNNPEKAFDQLKKLAKNGTISKKQLDRKVKRILQIRIWVRKEKTSDFAVIDSLFHTRRFLKTSYDIMEKSLCLVKTDKNLFPYANINLLYLYYELGKNCNDFISQAKVYAPLKKAKELHKNNLILTLNGDDKNMYQKADSIISSRDTVLTTTVVHFGHPKNLEYLNKADILIQVFDTGAPGQKLAGQALFGGIGLEGQLPEKYKTENYKYLASEKTRLGYCTPEAMGILSDSLAKIEKIIARAISYRAFPGCQVFVAVKGKVIYEKAFGYHTYKRIWHTKTTDLYDLASITKVAATSLGMMDMVGRGKIRLDTPLKWYFRNRKIDYSNIKPDTVTSIDTFYLSDLSQLPKDIREMDTIFINDTTILHFDTSFFRATPSRNVFTCTPREILMHRSGIPPSMPIINYLKYSEDTILPVPAEFPITQDSSRHFASLNNRRDTMDYLFHKYFNHYYDSKISRIKVAPGIYLRNNFMDTIWRDTKRMKVFSRNTYIYSDANAVILQRLIDSVNYSPMNLYLYYRFYKSLGCRRITYKPSKYYSRYQIVPTEIDKGWRRQLIHGYVHDETAALMGGMTGNAGLFSNAHDLGLLFQMFLNKGKYGGRIYLYENIVELFTATQPGTYRGLGFNKASSKNGLDAGASPETFGHTGFTGTCAWADPDNEVVFVFLSNRVYPTRHNGTMFRLKVRQNIQEVIYDELKAAGEYHSN